MARGFETIAVGQLVTADTINDKFIKQGVMYFDDATARDAAITSPEEGMHAYLADLDCETFYDGSAWQQKMDSLRKNSTGTVFRRRRLNLIEGTNITITVADDGTDNETDVTIASAVAPVDRATVSGFTARDFDLSTNTQLYRTFMDGNVAIRNDQVPVVAGRDGSIIGISVASTVARTAGSLTFEVYVNGTATGLTVTLDGTNTQYHQASQAAALDTFSAGDRIDVRGTNSSWTPIGNVEATVLVQYD